MRLVLVRHGESEHNRRGVLGGPAGCTGLTARGREQARALADRLRATGEVGDCSALLTTPLPRARQTAALLAPVLPIGALEEDADLSKVQPGAADGLAWEDYRTRYGDFDLVAHPHRQFAPGGESWSTFTSRVRTTLQRLASRYEGQTVVAVTHAGFIVASVLLLFEVASRRPGRLEPVPTSLTEWQVSGATWQLARYNDAYHLFGL